MLKSHDLSSGKGKGGYISAGLFSDLENKSVSLLVL